MHYPTRILVAAALAAFCHTAAAQVPQIINYQGRINVGSSPFTGTGQFRFALVNGDGSTSFWSNDGTSTAGSQPTAAVSLPVANGLYVVPLGETAIPNMQAVPATVFTNNDVRLRVWFNDGTNGSQLLSPDQRITSVGYAMVAGTVPDGSITTTKLAQGVGIPSGSVISFAGSSAPEGWLFCDGSEISRTAYPALFAAIGTAHGSGDGSTTFRLPDYRGRFLRGVDGGSGRDAGAGTRAAMNSGGQTGDTVGTVQGQATAKNGLTLTGGNHSHTIPARQSAASSGGFPVDVAAGSSFSSVVSNPSTASGSTSVTLSNGDAETRPINAAVHFLIKY